MSTRNKLKHPLVSAALVTLAGVSAPGLGHAQQASNACGALRSPANAVSFGQILDAPTTILKARVLPAERDLPEVCVVEGQVAPQVGFLLRMPTTTWNGKFMMGGCGGPCGNYLIDRIDPALVRNYAVVTTDMGHKGAGWAWANDNLQAQIDFGFRATHVTVLAAKEIIKTYYTRKAERNYYFGCSTGGRQGMVSAQRFPEDFDGIVAGAPVWTQTGNHPFFGHWGARVNIDKEGRPIMGAEKLPLVHDAVMKACDKIDGLADGILQDPRQCTWDPAEIQCAAGTKGDQCLSAEEVGVVRKIYDGARNSKGEALYAGMPRGSEDQWAGVWINAAGKPGSQLGGPGFINNSTTSYLAFGKSQGPGYSVFHEFDYDRDPPRLALAEYIYSPQQHDLRKFKARGGKLILWTGWHDNNMPPGAAIDYYETSQRLMGGPEQTRDFFRLFTPPAVNHCRGGIGGGEVDWITALERWVEQDEAPEAVIQYRPSQPYPTIAGGSSHDPGASYTVLSRHPMQPGEYDQARPVYAYPEVARYSGKGDATRPESWRKATARERALPASAPGASR